MTFGVGKREGCKIELASGFPAIVYHTHEPFTARLDDLNLRSDTASVLGVIHGILPWLMKAELSHQPAVPSFKFDEFSLYEYCQAVSLHARFCQSVISR
ncbi:hypothetical protein AB4Z43_01695 [Mesorhizobium sp. 2RAF45]|uniref:hypothetical protein n=1 Tax=Mesorhizobium sp. 2RAF45 TaxID=3233001 RepID=UPI003F95E3E7